MSSPISKYKVLIRTMGQYCLFHCLSPWNGNWSTIQSDLFVILDKQILVLTVNTTHLNGWRSQLNNSTSPAKPILISSLAPIYSLTFHPIPIKLVSPANFKQFQLHQEHCNYHFQKHPLDHLIILFNRVAFCPVNFQFNYECRVNYRNSIIRIEHFRTSEDGIQW